MHSRISCAHSLIRSAKSSWAPAFLWTPDTWYKQVGHSSSESAATSDQAESGNPLVIDPADCIGDGFHGNLKHFLQLA
jgi:hypothetical protein